MKLKLQRAVEEERLKDDGGGEEAVNTLSVKSRFAPLSQRKFRISKCFSITATITAVHPVYNNNLHIMTHNITIANHNKNMRQILNINLNFMIVVVRKCSYVCI